jgi:hypothetical protein
MPTPCRAAGVGGLPVGLSGARTGGGRTATREPTGAAALPSGGMGAGGFPVDHAPSPLAAAESPPCQGRQGARGALPHREAGAGDWYLFGAPIDRQKTNSTNEREATLDCSTLAPPDPAVMEPNKKRGRCDRRHSP